MRREEISEEEREGRCIKSHGSSRTFWHIRDRKEEYRREKRIEERSRDKEGWLMSANCQTREERRRTTDSLTSRRW